MFYNMFLNIFNKKNQQISGARNYLQSVGQIYKNQQLYIVPMNKKV